MNVNWNNILLGQVDHIEVERRLEFAALPSGWWTVATMIVAAVLVYAIIWFYRREGRIGASLRVRMVMAHDDPTAEDLGKFSRHFRAIGPRHPATFGGGRTR